MKEKEGFKTSWLGPVFRIAIVPMSHVTLAIIFLLDFLREVCQNPPHFIFKNSVSGLLWLLTCFFLIHGVKKKVILKISNIKAFFFFFTHIFNQPNLQICCKVWGKKKKTFSHPVQNSCINRIVLNPRLKLYHTETTKHLCRWEIKWKPDEADSTLERRYFCLDSSRVLIWLQGSFTSLILYSHVSFCSIYAPLRKHVLFLDFIFHWELLVQIGAAEIINERERVQQG